MCTTLNLIACMRTCGKYPRVAQLREGLDLNSEVQCCLLERSWAPRRAVVHFIVEGRGTVLQRGKFCVRDCRRLDGQCQPQHLYIAIACNRLVCYLNTLLPLGALTVSIYLHRHNIHVLDYRCKSMDKVVMISMPHSCLD
jgi:hypothetical protein